MTVMEIVLLLLGALIFAISFIIPESLSGDDKKGNPDKPDYPTAREVVSSMKEDINRQVRLAVEESADAAVDDAVVKSERNIEKATNEKMMAIDEYAQTVIRDIDKNHKEVVFLYDMLNNKSIDLKNTIRKAEDTRKQAEEEARKASEAAKILSAEKAQVSEKAQAGERAQVSERVQTPEKTQPLEKPPLSFEQIISPEGAGTPVTDRAAAGAVRERKELPPITSTIPPAPKPQIKPVRKSEKNVPRLGRAAAAAFAMEINEEMEAIKESEADSTGIEYKTSVNKEAEKVGTQSEAFANRIAAERRQDIQKADAGHPQMTESIQNPVKTPVSVKVPSSMEDDLNDLVISMYRVGTDDVNIARQLGIGVGEVRLMIQLYKQGNEES